MKKNIVLSALVVSVFCLVLFAGAGLVQAAAMDKGMMTDNGQMMIDKGQMMMDKGKMMQSKGMKTEGTVMVRDGKLLMRHGKAMLKAGTTGKKMIKKHYTPEKDFKGWLEGEGGG
jgi:hypothetical protein